MNDFDVIIVGGGIAGASLGAEIAARRRTLIIEAESHCGYHTTGRSAAFWLAHYGGPEVMPLTLASRPLLESGWPTGERALMRRRGILTIARHYMELREAIAANSAEAPVREAERGLPCGIPAKGRNALVFGSASVRPPAPVAMGDRGRQRILHGSDVRQ